jgi:hypothetical protein
LDLFGSLSRAGWQGIFLPGAAKFLQQYYMYCKKVWQSMAEKAPPNGMDQAAKQVLRQARLKCQPVC